MTKTILRTTLALVFLALTACTTTHTYLKAGDSHENLARVSRETPSIIDPTVWRGWIGNVIDTENESVIDSGPHYSPKRKRLDYVNLSKGRYKVVMDCNNAWHGVREYPTSLVLDVEARKEYVLGCRIVNTEMRDKLGFKIRKTELVVVTTKDFSAEAAR